MPRLRILTAFAALSGAAALLAPAAATPATSASALTAKIIDAYGGRRVLDAIHSTVQIATFSLQGQLATVTSTQEAAEKFLQVIAIPAYHATQITGFDGVRGWEADGYGHVKPLAGDRLALARCQAMDVTRAMMHPDLSISMSVKPSTKVEGKMLIPLVFIAKGCPELTLYIDPKTYLIVRVESELQTLVFSDFVTGPLGERYPKTATAISALGTYVTTTTSMKDNPTLDESIFAMPTPAPSATPVAPLTPAPVVTPAPAPTPSPRAT